MTRFARIVAAGLLSAAAVRCGSPETASATRTDDALPLTTMTVSVERLAEPLEAGGIVEPAASALVTSRVVAPVLAVMVRAGDRVRAGQVLVQLDDQALAAQERQAEAAVAAAEQAVSAARTEHASAQADEELAASWHRRIAALHEARAAAPRELDEAEARLASSTARTAGAAARVEQAASQLAAARAAADAAATLHGFATIRAPFDGLVTETMTDAGNLASPGVPLLRLDAAGPFRVEVLVDEARAAYVTAGDRVEVLIEPDTAGPIEGTVTEVARAVAADRRAFTVKVSLPEREGLRAGTFARVRFPGPVREALLVPATAIRRQGQVATLFVIEDAVARLRLVRTGLAADGRVEVLAGLAAGETIAVDPPPALADGRRVRPEPVSPESGAAP